MVEFKKQSGFMDIIKDGLNYISRIISASIFPPIADGAEIILKNIEEGIIQIEKRKFKRIYPFLVIVFGIIFLILALFFFLVEYLGWKNYAAFFSIGITVFIIGLLLKLGGSNK